MPRTVAQLATESIISLWEPRANHRQLPLRELLEYSTEQKQLERGLHLESSNMLWSLLQLTVCPLGGEACMESVCIPHVVLLMTPRLLTEQCESHH